jgi:beta-lactamase superfamily II metal-dependent hydrolase
MSTKFEQYRRGKEQHGGRTDLESGHRLWLLVGLLVILNGAAWFFAYPGYQKMLTQGYTQDTASAVSISTLVDSDSDRGPVHPGVILSQREPDELALAFLDVGQGDAIFMRTPNGNNILIDSGEGSNPDYKFARAVGAAKNLILPFFQRNKIKKLDYFITSHPHSDHIGSSYEIIQNMPIDEVWAAGYEHPSTSKKDMLNAIEEKKSKTDLKFKLPEDAGGTLEEGQPLEQLGPSVKGWLLRTAPNAENTNQASLVVLFHYGEVGILLTGDTERAGEKELIRKWGPQLEADILKVGHHGSRTSTIQPFVDVVKPDHSGITVGHYNTFGHPTDEVLSRLKRAGSKIHRTDTEGTIFLFTDGKTIDVIERPAISAVND